MKTVIGVAIACLLAALPASAQTRIEPGHWNAELSTPGGSIRFGFSLKSESDGWTAAIENPLERISIPQVTVSGSTLTLAFPHYDSAIEAEFVEGRLTGSFRKRRGKTKWAELGFSARPGKPVRMDDTLFAKFVGRWKVQFSKTDDPAIGLFAITRDKRHPWGTFLTTTGDYRFLPVQSLTGQTAELSVFDGAHAFLFRMRIDEHEKLTGDFWSSSSWHETFTGQLDPKAELPDAFRLTAALKRVNLNELKYRDLNGNLITLGDKQFAGKARIIQVFGSWCPNCHDAALYMAELHKKYSDRGLSIVGLAFEHTGEFERDAEMVRRYIKRHGTKYPVLIGGLSDKAAATKQFPLIDRVRSYPTTIFLDATGRVVSVYTGFSGPATGEAHQKLRARMEKQVEGLLGQTHKALPLTSGPVTLTLRVLHVWVSAPIKGASRFTPEPSALGRS